MGVDELDLRARVGAIHKNSRGVYRSARIHVPPRNQGIRTGRRRRFDMMEEHGRAGRSHLYCDRTTDNRQPHPVFPNPIRWSPTPSGGPQPHPVVPNPIRWSPTYWSKSARLPRRTGNVRVILPISPCGTVGTISLICLTFAHAKSLEGPIPKWSAFFRYRCWNRHPPRAKLDPGGFTTLTGEPSISGTIRVNE